MPWIIPTQEGIPIMIYDEARDVVDPFGQKTTYFMNALGLYTTDLTEDATKSIAWLLHDNDGNTWVNNGTSIDMRDSGGTRRIHINYDWGYYSNRYNIALGFQADGYLTKRLSTPYYYEPGAGDSQTLWQWIGQTDAEPNGKTLEQFWLDVGNKLPTGKRATALLLANREESFGTFKIIVADTSSKAPETKSISESGLGSSSAVGPGYYLTDFQQYCPSMYFGEYSPTPPGTKDLSNATITVSPSTFVYDGEAKTPYVTVTYGGVQLTEGVDYIKTYENNINPGTAAVLVAGQGDYTGSQRVYFTISSGIDTNDIANATITLSPSMYYYDGTAKTPNVTVKMGAVQLTEGTDYIKTYENNINEGLASVLVAGQGDYTGSKRAYFSIYAATNPYDNLEPSGPSNTTPTYDYSSDGIGLPTLPDISMADVGLVRIYNPTKAQLNSLAQYLWTDTTFVDTLINHFKQIFENPMNAIIALNLLPCPVPNSGAQELKVMYIPTGIQMNVATSQFVDVDCGKVTIETVYGSALDYAPYTKASIFLPYIGQVSLNVDEIMGKVLHVHYRVDIVTGGCVALVDVDGTVMYQFSGHCAISMPLSGADFSNLIGAMIQTAKSAATMVATGGSALAGVASAAMESKPAKTATPLSGDLVDLSRQDQHALGDAMEFAGLAAKNIANTVGMVMGAKPGIARTGVFSGNTGYLGVRRPYVILERPRLCNPAEYGRFNGYPSMQTVQLNNVRGYTQVQQVQLTGISATGPELDELQGLLKQGVIL